MEVTVPDQPGIFVLILHRNAATRNASGQGIVSMRGSSFARIRNDRRREYIMLYLFGTKAQSERIGKVDITCPQCGQRSCTLYATTNKATVYFVPVATLKRSYQVACGHCDSRWEIDSELGERLHGLLKPENTDPQAPSLPNVAAGLDTLRKAGAALDLLPKLRHAIGMDQDAAPPSGAITLTDDEAKAALQTAAGAGDIKQVKALLKKGVDVNSRDSGGWTPLMRASDQGHLEVVRLLLERGADVTGLSKNGFTALMRAFVNGHTDVVDLLRQSGAKA
jgi:hypothetical protein